MMELAPFATKNDQSRGRQYEEHRPDFRAPYQRDRDRIIHSTAFRRLMNKTQVFVVHEGDLYRTRLTHSIEVAQVARTLARRFHLNEDLAEVIALAHDLGHPPFGHTGEDVLIEKMKNYGGFDHNAQALRIVSKLEQRYIEFGGLNLTWESLEGIAKHNGPVASPVPWAMAPLCAQMDLELSQYASAEAQIAAIADDIAYNHHDLQDGLRAGLLDDAQVQSVPIIARAYEAMRARAPKRSDQELRYGALSIFFAELVEDVYVASQTRLSRLAPSTVDDIHGAGAPVIAFSETMLNDINELRAFLFKNLYRHSSVLEMRETAKAMVSAVFDRVMDDPALLPQDWHDGVDLSNETARAHLVCDYVSGMTDRYISRNWAFAHQKQWPNS